MTTCAAASRTLAEPLAGTAAAARTWLLIEQPGPWGKRALTESHLDPRLGEALETAASAHGARVALIRRPGRHADGPDGSGHHRVFLARTVPGDSWVRTALLPAGSGPEALRSLDFAALDGHGARPVSGDSGESVGVRPPDGLRTAQGPRALSGTRTRPHARTRVPAAARAAGLGPEWRPYEGDPLVLVCTNGKRDRCCALLGRPLAAELEASGAANVWEITHIGGHRFAPTFLVLPFGYAYGRLGAVAVKGVLDAVRDGHVLTEGCRGRSAWDRPGQAADLAVRERTGEVRAAALSVLATTPASASPAVPASASAEEQQVVRWAVTVGHEDGRRWRVTLAEADDGPALSASCGAAPSPSIRMDVEHFETLPSE